MGREYADPLKSANTRTWDRGLPLPCRTMNLRILISRGDIGQSGLKENGSDHLVVDGREARVEGHLFELREELLDKDRHEAPRSEATELVDTMVECAVRSGAPTP